MGQRFGMYEPMHFGAGFGNCRGRSGAPACGGALGKAQKAVRPAIRALSKSRPKMRRKLLLRGAQRFLGGNDAAVGIFYSHAQDTQKFPLIKRNACIPGNPLALGEGKAFFCQIHPGEIIDYLVIFVCQSAGRGAAQKGGRGGDGLAAHPFNEG